MATSRRIQIELFLLAPILILTGLALVRVGIRGEYIGGLGNVCWSDQRYGKAKRRHRVTSITLGSFSTLLGLLTFAFALGLFWPDSLFQLLP
jgi:hypothetical protein